MKLTEWLPESQKPDLVGYYERDYGIANLTCDYWDGSKWILVDGNGKHLPHMTTARKRWRGLVEDPNGSKP